MYLTIHAVSGILIGGYFKNSAASFVLGFTSHLLLDMLPHHDGNISFKIKSFNKKIIKSITPFYFDVCLGIIIAAILFTNNNQFVTMPIIWGMIGAILPDILYALSLLMPKNNLLKSINDFHNFVHYSPKKPISVFTGHLSQILILAIIMNLII